MQRARVAGFGVQAVGRVWPDADDLVVAGRKKKSPLGGEAEHVAGADPSASLDHHLRFVAGAAIELLGLAQPV